MPVIRTIANRPTATRREAVLLVLFVAHVLAFALLAPPWHHYDEPTNLEYALLIRELARLPAYDEQIPALRQTIARSMGADPMFAQLDSARAVSSPDLTLGFNQRVHPPTYYMLTALATIPVRSAPIELQLQIARLASVALAALCFYLAVRATRLLVTDDAVRLFALAALACLPPFAEIMSAVNSDVLANTVAVALLWAAAALQQQPARRGVWIALLVIGMALVVKRALVAPAGLLLLVVAWPMIRRAWRHVGLALAALLGLGWLTLATLPPQLADWTPVPPEAEVAQHTRSVAFTGTAAFALTRPPAAAGPMVVQELDPIVRSQASGHLLTISGQMRADRPGAMALGPAIQLDQRIVADSVVVGTTWTPVSISAYVPPATRYLAVRLNGPFSAGTVFYDDLALVLDSAPAGPSADGLLTADLLDPTVAHNLLRNPGAERTQPNLLLIVPAPLRAFLARPTVVRALSTVGNVDWIAAAYPRQIELLFRGFWGSFSWGEISVPAGWLLSISLAVAVGLFGAIWLSVRISVTPSATAPLASAGAWWLCLSMTVVVWAVATVRVHLQPVPGVLIWSFGRYTYAAVLPALIVFGAGLHALLPRTLRVQTLVAVGVFLAIYAGAALGGTLLPIWRH